MLESILPSIPTSYMLFFYLGVFIFLLHIYSYGIGLDLSYFGLFLMYIGWAKPTLHSWFRNVLWFFILLDLWAHYRKITSTPKKKRLPDVIIDKEED
jgi:uncharacterized membrane protein (DUF373 family)